MTTTYLFHRSAHYYKPHDRLSSFSHIAPFHPSALVVFDYYILHDCTMLGPLHSNYINIDVKSYLFFYGGRRGCGRKRQVETLVNMAFQKGIYYAIRVAKKLSDPYILDEFHDDLTTKLYEQLVGEKKIKKL